MLHVISSDVSVHSTHSYYQPNPACEDAIELVLVGIGLVTVPLVVCLYIRNNRQREKLLAEGNGEKHLPEDIRELGNHAPEFRYML